MQGPRTDIWLNTLTAQFERYQSQSSKNSHYRFEITGTFYISLQFSDVFLFSLEIYGILQKLLSFWKTSVIEILTVQFDFFRPKKCIKSQKTINHENKGLIWWNKETEYFKHVRQVKETRDNHHYKKYLVKKVKNYEKRVHCI